ncbi:MAG: GIY-YIG nuclease family protein [Spirochaetales bacterium]|nr:GIY-YIG nuclease family protein [Spirochaetales bacterium]
MKQEGSQYIYMLHTAGGRLYTGYTTNPERRLTEHLKGSKKAARFTRAFRPLAAAACWRLDCSRGEALKVEAAIKRLPRLKKLSLLEHAGLFENLAAQSCGRIVKTEPFKTGAPAQVVPKEKS